MDRVVTKRHFTSTRSHFWWPRRKDEDASRDAAFDEEIKDSIDDSLADKKGFQSNLFQSGRHVVPKRIHILGAGNLGAFVAHSLAGIPNRPPITLLLRSRQLRAWKEYGRSIEVITRDMRETRRGFEAETVRRLLDDSSLSGENLSEKGEDLSSKTGTEEREGYLSNDSTSNTEALSDVDAPSLKDSNLVADASLRKDRPDDSIALEVSVSKDDKPSMTETETRAWFAEAEQDVDEVQHNEKSSTARGQIRTSDEQEEIIYNLIVSVKAPQTVRAIQAVAHRLTQDSSILFLQNGMGVVDEVNMKLFPDEKYRPTYIVGVVSHGLYSKGPFSVLHAGEGTIALGVLPRMPLVKSINTESMNQLSPSARYLMRTMTRTAVFVAVGFPPTELLQQQYDKLAVNCIINPLTAVLDCKNGALLYNFYYQRVVRLLLAEISLVIKSLPELKNVPNVNMRFDTLRLERLVFIIANMTAENYSSMVQDIRSGRLTEIDYINGYIVKRGEEMGIHCVMNYMLMHMVKGKNKNIIQEKADLLPLAGQRS